MSAEPRPYFGISWDGIGAKLRKFTCVSGAKSTVVRFELEVTCPHDLSNLMYGLQNAHQAAVTPPVARRGK